MMFVGLQSQPYDNSNVVEVVHSFWCQFDVDPGVWMYKFRVGMKDWFICDHLAETGKMFRYADSQGKI